MGVIWTSKTRTRQPTRFARADTGRLPITHLWSGSAGVDTFIPDAAGTAHGTKGTLVAGQGYYIKPAGDSVVIEFDTSVGGANSQIINLGDASGSGGPRRLTAFTLFMEFMVPSISQAVFYSSGAGGLQFSLESGGILNLVKANVAVIGVASTAVATTNVWHKAAVSYDGTNYQFVLNGVSAGSGSNAVTVSPVQQYFGGLVVGPDSYGAPPNGSKLKTFAVIDKVCSVEEMRQLCVNPWQLFAPERRPIFIDVASGGGSPYSMDAEAGSYAVTGVSAAFQASRTLVAEAGSYTLTGVAAGLSYGHSLTAEAGSYVVSGQDATFTYTPVGSGSPYSMDADAGSYTLTGVSAAFQASRTLLAAAGSYALTGVDTSFTRSGYRLVAETGSYVISGQSATFSTTGTTTPTTGGGGGKGHGSNLSRKQKKKLKAVESQEWLKAEETARQLLSDRFTKQTPQEKAQALETYIESLQPVIEALKALTTQIEEVVEDAPVIELTQHQEVIQRFDRLEKKVKSVEELIIILMADL